jgi:hypothetical protein
MTYDSLEAYREAHSRWKKQPEQPPEPPKPKTTQLLFFGQETERLGKVRVKAKKKPVTKIPAGNLVGHPSK